MRVVRFVARVDIGIRLMIVVGLMMISGCDRATTPRSVPTPQPTRTEASIPTESPRSPLPDDWFEDVTTQVGVQASYHTGRSAGRNLILETVGGGVGLVDFDLDSRLDIYAVGGGTIDAVTAVPVGVAAQLFQQYADERFRDVSINSGLSVTTDYSHGILAGDYDNDGFPDLFFTCYSSCHLWQNQGDGTFKSVTEAAGLTIPGWHTAAAFADLNGDGHLDLFIADYVDWSPENNRHRDGEQSDVAPPQLYSPTSDHLFLSLGDGRFEQASTRAGVRSDGMGLGVVACDLNDDGRADIYVANDVVGNHLYWGSTNFPLQEAGELSGVAYNELGTPEGSMGVDAEDVNGDGTPDLWVTNFELEDNSLYLNLKEGLFQHATVQMGLAGVGRKLVGFGTGFQDFDGDGWPDLYILNGHVKYHSSISPFKQPAFILRNREGQRFEDVTMRAGPWFSIPHSARGGAAGDWNNDGAVDLLISSLDEPLVVLRNRLTVPPALRVRLVGIDSPRDPIGATVRVTHSQRTLVQFVKSGSGYLSQSDPRLRIPKTSGSPVMEIMVGWPSQRRERFQVTASQEEIVLVEGRGTLVEGQ